MKKIDLTGNWSFRKSGSNAADEWQKAEVPGTVHTDLLSAGLIPEPFYNDNEKYLSWVAETDWEYKTNFILTEKDFIRNFDLVFDGLDTIAKITLNGNSLGETDNMFRQWKFDVSQFLKIGKNELAVVFTSAYSYAKAQEFIYGKLPVALNSERVYIRKAQYSFGWDWGPIFATCGIWRPVYLQQNDSPIIENIAFTTKSVSKNSALVEVGFNLSLELTDGNQAEIIISKNEFRSEKIVEDIKSDFIGIQLEISKPELWWPNGMGNQNFYDVTVNILDKSGNVIDSKTKKVGIRTIELQLKDSGKNTFRFKVNGKKIFSQGVNWIPADSFLPRVTKDKYRKLLEQIKNANMNIVRVWGGGIYEDDYFYETCDELGLMVWQDFMFACGAYPEHDKFLENIREEFRQNILRLQHHPSLAIWCGNNESEWNWSKEQGTPIQTMPGFQIFRTVLPEIISELDSSRPYWQSTPFGSDESPNSPEIGNRHEWGLWSGFADVNTVKNDQSLFVSEFGFQGTANQKTFEKYISEKNRTSQSQIFEWHNKAFDGPEKLLRYMSATLPVKMDWDSFIYLGQLTQLLCLKTCLEYWRGNQPTTNGTIIWQINDCWPVTSWALIDSELKPKMAYYGVKSCFSPSAVFLEFAENKLKAKIFLEGKSEIYSLIISCFDWVENTISELDPIVLRSNDNDIFQELGITVPMSATHENCIFISSLRDISGALVHRNVLNLIQWKYITLPETKISLHLTEDKKQVTASSQTPSFFVKLESETADFFENSFTLLPGEVMVCAENKNFSQTELKDISVQTLNDMLNEK